MRMIIFVASKRLKTPQLEKHGAYLLITEHFIFLLFHRWKGFALTAFRSVPGQCQQYRGQAGGFQSQVVTGSSDGAGWRGELTNLISYLNISWLCVSNNGFVYRKNKPVSVWTPHHSSWSVEDWITASISGTSRQKGCTEPLRYLVAMYLAYFTASFKRHSGDGLDDLLDRHLHLNPFPFCIGPQGGSDVCVF